jgi:glutamate-1-semialdehyde 2,1-aminomutase/spore coat polysaccharide biosynthesis protein SpsF
MIPSRLLVVGCGSIGTRHIGNLQELGVRDLVAFDTDPERRAEVARRFGVQTVDTLKGDWNGVNAVVIATPSSLHVPLATEAARRGCHLFIEKPLSDSLAGVPELLETVRRKNTTVLVGCNLRFHPGLKRVKQLIDEGAIGRPVSAHAEMGYYLPDWRPTEDYRTSYSARRALGGGIILDAIHEIDYLMWMLGEVSNVSCFAGTLSGLNLDVEDTAAILLRFASGAIGEVHVDYIQRSYSRTCRVIGDDGSISWDYIARRVELFSPASGKWRTALEWPDWDLNDMYREEIAHFLACLRGDERPLIDATEGARALSIALAAKQSAVSGGIVAPSQIAVADESRGLEPHRAERVVALIQARMESTRLPGKVLADIAGRPMLSHVIERVRRSGCLDQVAVVTSHNDTDDPIATYCAQNGIECFRGSEDDVLDRFYRAAIQYDAAAVVRITADCPLLDSLVLDRVVEMYRAGDYDYVANTLHRTFPDGLDVEIVSFPALAQAWRESSVSTEREHVTTYIRIADKFRTRNIEHNGDHAARCLRLTVDEPRDLDFIRAIYDRLGASEGFGLAEVLQLLAAEPALVTINAGIIRNEGYYRSLRAEPPIPARTRTLVESAALAKRAERVIPSGTQTFSKAVTQFVQGVAPTFLARGQGSHVWDADGNEYIDYPMALGPVILGHNYAPVTAAVERQLRQGVIFSLAHPLEVELAETLVRIIPCAEMVRFAKNGSDATAGAVRVARAFTGRDVIACCGYHGWQDWYIGTTTRSRGVPVAVQKLTRTFQYNDIESLERVFAEHQGQVAAVIMEPVGVIPPAPGFLEQVKAIAHREGSLLVFDEVVTGFRLSLGGAQELFNVVPDLGCFGKALGNGYPIAVIAGRRDVMRLFDEIFFSFTFGGDTIAIAAALATIAELESQNVIAHLWEQGERLRAGYNVLAGLFGLQQHTACIGLAPRTVITFTDGRAESLLLKSLFQQECLKRGILFSGGQNVCYSHTDADIDYTLRVYRTAMEVLAEAIAAGDVAGRLEGPSVLPVFRRA